MTGFESKRRVAQAKMDDDDDTQVYADTLLIVYQRGYADGKRSEQRKPLTDDEIRRLCKDPEVFETVKEGVRMIEAAHNIKEQP